MKRIEILNSYVISATIALLHLNESHHYHILY
jgi:hypothetical protein